MMLPTINIQAMNVELTHDQSQLITQKLAPLARLAPDLSVRFDVVLRISRTAWAGTRFSVSVRMTTNDDKYYSVVRDAYLGKAFSAIRDDLRRSISTGYRVQELQKRTRQQYMTERQYATLFA